MQEDDLKARLVEMAERDLRLRADLATSGELIGGYNERMAAIHNQNGEYLDRIVDEHGWPGRSLVGREGADAAWLILQHAIGSPALQRKCLPILWKAAEAGELPPSQVACLEDRIHVFEGRPQRYGTQFDWDGSGELSPHPIEDIESVDEYRASVGLGPLSAEIRRMRRRAAKEGHLPPDDFDEYRRARKAWARSVGWF